MDIRDRTLFDPDCFLPRPRRHTDQPRPVKPTALPALSPRPAPPRPRTRSFINVSLDCSTLSLVGNGQNKVQISAEVAVEEGRPRRNSGGEVSKRVLELAAPTKRAVYTKDLDLVDTKVKLSRLRVQWPLSAGERKSKSTSRVRVSSAESTAGVKVQKRPAKHSKPESSTKAAPVQRCVSEEKQKTYALKGPSECKTHVVDLLLVRQYNEDQQHLMATIRDLTSGKWEQHSILRSRMQEFAPWAAADLPQAERMDKAVHFL